jgi:flagellar biosynthesis GTPase FlhF
VRRSSSLAFEQHARSEEIEWLFDVLANQEVDLDIAQTLLLTVRQRMSETSATTKTTRSSKTKSGSTRRRRRGGEDTRKSHCLDLAREELMSLIRVASDPCLSRGKQRKRIACLVGPPGVGKTTTLVKLAMLYGVHSRHRVQILSIDNYRIAAAEQLRSYATILGIGFESFPNLEALERGLDDYSSKDLVLLDTPGLSAQSESLVEDLSEFLDRTEESVVHLVLSASMKQTDLKRLSERVQDVPIDSLIFTKLDETEVYGSLLNEAYRMQKPVTYLCTGQRVPEDIEAASKTNLQDLLLPKEFLSAENAA